MIDRVYREETQADALKRHVREELAGYDTPSDLADQVAHSVAVYCTPELERAGLPDAALHGILSRALWSVGEQEVAEHFLLSRVEHQAIRQTLLALLRAREVAPWLWSAVVRGVVRLHPVWASCGDQPLWSLRFDRVAHWQTGLPLERLMLLRTVLTGIAPVWDPTQGKGVLGVKWAYRTAPAHDTDEDWKAQTGQFLQIFAHRRGWVHMPQILQLS